MASAALVKLYATWINQTFIPVQGQLTYSLLCCFSHCLQVPQQVNPKNRAAPGGEDSKIKAAETIQVITDKKRLLTEHHNTADLLKPASTPNVCGPPQIYMSLCNHRKFTPGAVTGRHKHYWQSRGWFEVEVVPSAFVLRPSPGSECVHVGEKQEGHVQQSNLIKLGCARLSLHPASAEGSLICAANLAHVVSAG